MDCAGTSNKTKISDALHQLLCNPCDLLGFCHSGEASNLRHTSIVVYRDVGVQAELDGCCLLQSNPRSSCIHGNTPLKLKSRHRENTSKALHSDVSTASIENIAIIQPHHATSKLLRRSAGIPCESPIYEDNKIAESSSVNFIKEERGSKQRRPPMPSSKGLPQLHTDVHYNISTEDSSTDTNVLEERPAAGRRAFSDTHVNITNALEDLNISESSASTPLDRGKPMYEANRLLHDGFHSSRLGDIGETTSLYQVLHVPREPRSSLQQRFAKSMQRVKSPSAEAHKWTPNRLSTLRWSSIHMDTPQSGESKHSNSTGSMLPHEQPSADTHNSSDTPPSFRVPVAVPTSDYFNVSDASYSDLDIPDHLEGSPLCPVNPRNRKKGSWCRIHGSGPSDMLYLPFGGLESARHNHIKSDTNLSLAQDLTESNMSRISRLEGSESVNESRHGGEALLGRLAMSSLKLGRHKSGVDILNMASRAYEYPLPASKVFRV